jgi:hypothetical protein
VPNVAGFVPRPGSREAVELLGANLADHAMSAVANVMGEAPRLEQSVFAAGITSASADALGALARKLWSHARTELIAEAGRLYALDKNKDDANTRMRFGSYFWSEDWPAPTQNDPPETEEKQE